MFEVKRLLQECEYEVGRDTAEGEETLGFDSVLFSLTPALSLGEREKRWSVVGEIDAF